VSPLVDCLFTGADGNGYYLVSGKTSAGKLVIKNKKNPYKLESPTMKTINKIGLVTVLFSAVAAMPAHADFIDNASTNGGEFFEDVFFGGAFGQSEADSYCSSAESCNGEDTSWKVYGGYKINSMLDAEVTYHSLGDINRTTDGSTETAEMSALSISGVGKYQINDSVEALGKVGIASWSSDNSDDDDSGFGMTYGFGAKVALNENMKIRAEWENITGVTTSNGRDSDVTTMSLGIEMQTF